MMLKSVWTKTALSLVAAGALVACGGSDDPVATPVERDPGWVATPSRWGKAYRKSWPTIAASQSVFITVDTAARPASFQRLELAGPVVDRLWPIPP
jgi:hypothetical protein